MWLLLVVHGRACQLFSLGIRSARCHRPSLAVGYNNPTGSRGLRAVPTEKSIALKKCEQRWRGNEFLGLRKHWSKRRVVSDRLYRFRSRGSPPRGRLREAEAEFQEFTMKARCAPTWMSGTHLLDQVLDFGRHRRSTMTNSAFPFPIQPKALAVPSDDGLGFHDAQGGAPIGATFRGLIETNSSPMTMHLSGGQLTRIAMKLQVF
jgi:hypothetical protein